MDLSKINSNSRNAHIWNKRCFKKDISKSVRQIFLKFSLQLSYWIKGISCKFGPLLVTLSSGIPVIIVFPLDTMVKSLELVKRGSTMDKYNEEYN